MAAATAGCSCLWDDEKWESRVDGGDNGAWQPDQPVTMWIMEWNTT